VLSPASSWSFSTPPLLVRSSASHRTVNTTLAASVSKNPTMTAPHLLSGSGVFTLDPQSGCRRQPSLADLDPPTVGATRSCRHPLSVCHSVAAPWFLRTLPAVVAASTSATSVPSTPPSALPRAPGLVSSGGTSAAPFCRYCKSTTHEIEQCRRRSSQRKGVRVSQVVLVSPLHSRLLIGSLSSPDG
jgi:hypothetical protein